MRIHRSTEGPGADRQAGAPAEVHDDPAAAGGRPGAGAARGSDVREAGYGVVASISNEARTAAEKADKEWRPNVRYIFEQGLAFAHQAVDRRRLARAVRKHFEAEAVGQSNRFAAMDAERAHGAAARAGERLRRARPDLVA